jgi:Leucine Rich repeat
MPIHPSFLKRIIDKDPSVTKVIVTTSDENDLITLFDALKSNTTVTILDLQYSYLNSNCKKSFCELLQINTTITTISLMANELYDEALRAILDALDNNPDTAVTSLDLSYNEITDSSKLLSSQVISNKLTDLNLECNSLSGLSFASRPTKITTLNLGGNFMGDNIGTFCGFLNRNKNLTSLDLSDQNEKIKGGEILYETLKANNSLSYLRLYRNQLNDVDARYLSEVLATNHSITTLDLTDNCIGNAGTKLLSEALKTNNTLRSLALAGNLIDELSAQYLSEALATNRTLTTLDIGSSCHKEWIIGGNIGKHICDLLKNNNTLTSINISEGDLREANLKTIIDALTTNYSLLAITTTIKQKTIPGSTPFLTRNTKILSCLQPLHTLANDISFIAGIDAEKMITDLTSLVPFETIAALDETHSLAEQYRLLTAIGHITNANQYIIANAKKCPNKEQLKLEAELNALECLLPNFTRFPLQKISDLVLSHFILGGTISKRLIDKQPLAFHQLGFHLSSFHNANLRLFVYNALFNFLKPTETYSIANKKTFENEIALLSEQEFCVILHAARDACWNSLTKKGTEIFHLQQLQELTANKKLLPLLEASLSECQYDLEELKKEFLVLAHGYAPDLTRILPSSPYFVAQFRKHYPSCETKSFFIPFLCIFSKKSFLINLSQQGNLPTIELEKYGISFEEEFDKLLVNQLRQVRTEINRAVVTCRAELKTNPGINQDSDTPIENQAPLSLTITNGKRKIEELAIDNSSEEKPAKKPKIIQEALTNNFLIFATQTPPVETTEAKKESSSDRIKR